MPNCIFTQCHLHHVRIITLQILYVRLQVEDMLKRSFAESRAQMAAPGTQTSITAARDELAALQQRPWPPGALGTTREQVDAFHAACMRLQYLTLHMQVGMRVDSLGGCAEHTDMSSPSTCSWQLDLALCRAGSQL